WRSRAVSDDDLEASCTFGGFESALLSQVVDLEDLRAQGWLQLPDRELGIDAPSGARWYNFTVAAFLDCACAYMFPAEDEDSDVTALSWAQARQFLRAGQMYE